ncbi:unnamed protein product [Ostreobium quekettii]|uniref:AMP-dependent synthetase/ligase domain-containing protein n=1 Tax=Ostreobium quekettii TaxID=121088 RepID=A0A8S1JID6_9CHLO|nr:unnamed protein product [Ostreobium quekettii]|eukprot:evm.model.scf_52.11 EVM.evm.TU.scf_52.11   scf_52:104396-111109(+)
MPMTVTSVVAYLGIVLSGCVVVSIADSFSPPEVASRLKIAGAVAIMTQDVILRGGKTFALFSRVVEANAPMAIVCPGLGDNLQVNLREGDMEYSEFLASGGPLGQFQPYSADGYEATNILFSSGTTGEPKAIPYTHLTPIRCAVDGFAHQDIRHRDVVCWPTNLGWMMGPWLVYAALLNGATIALFEGSPLGREFCQFVSAARVTQLGVVPSIVRAWREGASVKGIDWASIRCFSSTGEASTPEEYHWLMAQAGYKPVIEYCGALVQCLIGPLDFICFVPAVRSELALVPPMLGNSQKLLNRDHFLVYYDGMPMLEGTSMPLRRHGDEVERLPGGYYCAHGRCDDTMNLGGIKVSSIELERAVMANVQQVKEAAAVGVTPSGSGPQKLVLFLVPKAAGHQPGASKFRELCQKAVRTELNPLFKVADVVLCESLPRTASNKIMRRLLRSRYGKGRSRL